MKVAFFMVELVHETLWAAKKELQEFRAWLGAQRHSPQFGNERL